MLRNPHGMMHSAMKLRKKLNRLAEENLWKHYCTLTHFPLTSPEWTDRGSPSANPAPNERHNALDVRETQELERLSPLMSPAEQMVLVSLLLALRASGRAC